MTDIASLLLQLALALGVPALIGLFAPRRWRLWIFFAWLLAPLIVLLALAASEIASGKASVADLDKLFFGLMLIGSILAIPWLLACGLGFGVGVALRGGQRSDPAAQTPSAPAGPPQAIPEPVVAAEPVARIMAPRETDGPSLSLPGGWQAAHVGFAQDDLELDGLPVWALPWQAVPVDPVLLDHPAYPGQQHRFAIYLIDDGVRAMRFAAAELSNGVWGFYRWIVPTDAASATSGNGALRYQHDLGERLSGRYDAVAPVARLFDAQSGALLFDGAHWRSSRIVPQTDGTLLLALEQGDRQTILRIDPAAMTFRDLAVPGGERPLRDLAGEAAAARAACDVPANAYLGRRVAPDGSIVVDLESVEWSNTHWVRSPRVTQVATGWSPIDLWGTDWDAVPYFPRPQTVHLSLRRYHAGGGAEVEIDLSDASYTLFEPDGATTGPLSHLRFALETAAAKAAANAPRRPGMPAPPLTVRNWLVALAILVGALVLIAGATLLTEHFRGDPPKRTLDRIPAMPGPFRPR